MKKPCYSIEELADLLGMEIYTVADGLVLDGVRCIHRGEEVSLSNYDCFSPPLIGNERSVFIYTGAMRHPEPDPSTVTVSANSLPPLWVECINKAELPHDENGRSIEEQKKLPTEPASSEKPEINSATFDKLLRVLEAFPSEYKDGTPKLKDDVRVWLRSSMNCNDREGQVFGTILSEHYNISGGTKKTKK